MLSFNPYCWSTLHITWTPTFGEFMPHYSPQLVKRWTCVSSPLLSHTPHRRRTGGSRWATQRGVQFDLGGVSHLTFWRQGWILVWSIFIFYFVRLPLCNKYSDYIVTFISIHSVIIYVVFFGACMRCTRFCPLNPSVTVQHRTDTVPCPVHHHVTQPLGFGARTTVGALSSCSTGQSGTTPDSSVPLWLVALTSTLHCWYVRVDRCTQVAVSPLAHRTPDCPVNYSGARLRFPESGWLTPVRSWCTGHSPVRQFSAHSSPLLRFKLSP
jgi:hypothetical protein